MDIDVGYKASDPGSMYHSGVFYFILYYTVKLDLNCSSSGKTPKTTSCNTPLGVALYTRNTPRGIFYVLG